MVSLPIANIYEQFALARAQGLGASEYGMLKENEITPQAEPFLPFWEGWKRDGAISWLFAHNVMYLDMEHQDLWNGADYEAVVGKHACGLAKEIPEESLEIVGFATGGFKVSGNTVRLQRCGKIPHRQEGYDITVYDLLHVANQLKEANLPLLRALFAPDYAVLRCTPAATLMRRWRRLYWTRPAVISYIREAMLRIKRVRDAGGERYQLLTAMLLLAELRAILTCGEADIRGDRDLLLWARDEPSTLKVISVAENMRSEALNRFKRADLAEKPFEPSCQRLVLAMLIRNHGPISDIMRQILEPEDVDGAEILARTV